MVFLHRFRQMASFLLIMELVSPEVFTAHDALSEEQNVPSRQQGEYAPVADDS